jgi:hypothetical protein
VEADAIREFVVRVEQDRRTLQDIMRERGVERQTYKLVGARVAEAAGLLKMNGTVVRRSPLSSVLELEMLMAGVAGKRALWQSLEAAKVIDADRARALIESADDQAHRLSQIHAARAAEVLNQTTESKPAAA